MPEVNIEIGGRVFQVACQTGEEHFLQSAAKLLDNEASVLAQQIGRMPEPRMLLMAGLMLADKTAGLEEELRLSETKNQELAQQLRASQSAPAPTTEVAVIPNSVTDSFAEIAARAEAIADSMENDAA
jgi:cell division protein ZapA